MLHRVLTGIVFCVDDNDASVREDHLDLDEVIDTQPVHPADEPEPSQQHDRRPDRMRRPSKAILILILPMKTIISDSKEKNSTHMGMWYGTAPSSRSPVTGFTPTNG